MHGHDKIANKMERWGCSSRFINLIVNIAIAIPALNIINPIINNCKTKPSILPPAKFNIAYHSHCLGCFKNPSNISAYFFLRI